LHRAEDKLESTIPAEDEVQRLKMEVSELEKEIKSAKNAVAEERVEAREQRKKVIDLAEQVKASKATLDARALALKAAEADKEVHFVKVDGRNVDFTAAKDALQNLVRSQNVLEKNLQSEESMLTSREKSRELAEQHMKALVSQKSELESILTEMEADIKQLKIEQIESKYQNDGTKMAEIKESIGKLKKKIAVQREKLNMSKKGDTSAVETKSVDQIMAELDSTKGKSSVAEK